jgi:hypothetical protein
MKRGNYMIEHKAYECEFCSEEFDNDEYELALKHEKNLFFVIQNIKSVVHVVMVKR